MHAPKVPQHLINAYVDKALLRAGEDIVANTAAGVVNVPKGAIVRRCSLVLTSVAVAVTAALDYASIKLADLPDGNLLLLGGHVDLTFVAAGGVATPANVDVALGTAAASNATLSSTMLNVIPKIDATSGSVVKGAATTAEAGIVIATSSTDLFLNVAVAIATDGSVTFSGTIDLFFLDLGNQA